MEDQFHMDGYYYRKSLEHKKITARKSLCQMPPANIDRIAKTDIFIHYYDRW